MHLFFVFFIISQITLEHVAVSSMAIDIVTGQYPNNTKYPSGNAIDNDTITAASPNGFLASYWYIQLNSPMQFMIKYIYAELSGGGLYKFFVNGSTEGLHNDNICDSKNITGGNAVKVLAKCPESMYGNRVWIQKVGIFYLYEVKIVVCSVEMAHNGCYTCGNTCIPNQHGCLNANGEPLCTPCENGFFGHDCKNNCFYCPMFDCDNVSGNCRSCEKGKYGDKCQKICSTNCTDDGCEQISGRCLSCDCFPHWCGNDTLVTNFSCIKACSDDNGINSPNHSSTCDGLILPKKKERNLNSNTSSGYSSTECVIRCVKFCEHCRGIDEELRNGQLGDQLNSSMDPGQPSTSSSESVSNDAVIAVAVVVPVGVIVIVVFLIKRYLDRRVRNSNSDQNGPAVTFITLQQLDGAMSEDVIYQNTTEACTLLVLNRDITESATSVNYCTTGNRIPVGQFVRTAEEMKISGKIAEEFKALPEGLLEDHTEALRPLNKSLNRYRSVFPYDFNRVTLKEDDDGSDYINASVVHAYSTKNGYIAAQGPFTERTMVDFWRMIWQENCRAIVMLTNLFELGKMKCLKYWPEIDDMKFGQITVKTLQSAEFPDYTKRTFEISRGDDLRDITQFHFTSWPDTGVPISTNGMLHFRNKVREHTAGKSPLVIHCSAGIGRTGTFIALDYLIDMAQAEKSIDIVKFVNKLRHQRANVVQSLEQYEFLYDALAGSLKESTDPYVVEEYDNGEDMYVNGPQNQ